MVKFTQFLEIYNSFGRIFIDIKLLFGNPIANFGPLRGQSNSNVANKEIKLGPTFASIASTNRARDFLCFV